MTTTEAGLPSAAEYKPSKSATPVATPRGFPAVKMPPAMPANVPPTTRPHLLVGFTPAEYSFVPALLRVRKLPVSGW